MIHYPGFSRAFEELVSVMARQVESEETWPLVDWIAREMHAASAEEIAELLDRASAKIVAAVPDYQRRRVLAHLESMRADANDAIAGERSRDRDDVAADALQAALGAIDPSLSAHAVSVGELAGRIACRLHLDAPTVREVGVAGRLLDVGYLAVPRSRESESHPYAGERIVGAIAPLKRYARWVRMHHERLDGSGYPDGLWEPQIPTEARILAVADVFAAMTEARPYRDPYTPHAAIEYLCDRSGTAFDARVVASLTRLMSAKRPIGAGDPAAAYRAPAGAGATLDRRTGFRSGSHRSRRRDGYLALGNGDGNRRRLGSAFRRRHRAAAPAASGSRRAR